jgi:acetolactate synthase I/II/III large subunit
MTGAMFVAQCLKQEGVTKVFGQCGHTNYALIDACQQHGIEYISFRHEQMAAHAADAYFRVSHKLAVLNVHLSPGMTNALTGVISAAADATPMLVICGNTPTYNHAREPHQGIRFHADASQGDIYRPFCKRVWRVDDAKLLVDVMPRALNVAQTGCPGAVLIDVPMDVFSTQVDFEAVTVSRRPSHARGAGSKAGIAEAAGLLLAAAKPVIFVGNGVLLSEACDELKELAELTQIPVATTNIRWRWESPEFGARGLRMKLPRKPISSSPLALGSVRRIAVPGIRPIPSPSPRRVSSRSISIPRRSARFIRLRLESSEMPKRPCES